VNLYESLTNYTIRFVVEWPDFEILSFPNPLAGKDKSESSYVCKLQLKEMMEEGELSPYQKHEATSQSYS
jgi:hypothetical protein